MKVAENFVGATLQNKEIRLLIAFKFGIRNKLKLVRFWIQHLPPMEFEAILQDDDENKDYGRSSQNWAIYAPVDGPAGKR